MLASGLVIRSRMLHGLPEFLEARGVAISGLLDAAGLPSFDAMLDGDDIPLVKVARLFELAADATGRPCFGMEFADTYQVGASGPYGFLIAHAPTVRVAFENVALYVGTVARPMDVNFSVDADGIGHMTWVYPIGLAGAILQYTTFTLTLIIKRLRWSAGDDWVPLRVDVMHRDMPCAALYRSVYGERIRFNQAHNQMLVDPTTLARRSTSADPHLYRAVQIAANAELASLASPNDTISSVRRLIQQRLQGGAPELDDVASAMGLKKGRQLQWKLEQDGTTFETELAETRRLVAERLLATTDLTMTQIAASVGFSELSSFTRASKHWFGVAPSEYRASSRLVTIAVHG